MKLGIIPYQEGTDIVYKNALQGQQEGKRPNLPQMEATHQIKSSVQGTSYEFVRTEDIPLNRRHFVYRPCSANPFFTILWYGCTEYPFDHSGMSVMDRSEGLSISRDGNDLVSVPDQYGWRTARSDVCIKEGMTYWEVEVIRGGNKKFADGVNNKENADDSVDEVQSGIYEKMHKQVNDTPHLRFGVCRREASLEAPVGFDVYGYGIRDISLESIHEGKLNCVLENGSPLKEGDKIGFLLSLPSIHTQIKQAKEFTKRRIFALNSHMDTMNEPWREDAENGPSRKKLKQETTNKEFQRALLEDIEYNDVVRDQIAIRYKNQLFFEATDYVKTTKPEYYSSDKRERQDYYQLEDSYLAIFQNGKYLGKAFENLKPFLPPFSELQYNEKFYLGYWQHGEARDESNDKNTTSAKKKKQQQKKKKGLILRNKYVNNNKLGYYPTISCFNGGTARIISEEDKLEYLDQIRSAYCVDGNSKVNTLDTLYKEQIAEDIVWDIIDELEQIALQQ
ncbi:ANM_HP_G0018230.mRNA.1.CDS.1 [Saccharomyces cerevisiae]|nr:ANM_HP_G0161700.mRNA.1.CDS.1 [Saccharomyces cerevisiae]CAI5206010.1 ANM_HP_G0260060.mRNA.1.CDS.1 [Saccharomyces cerevisiae]CAI5215163.1 ANM_HP_G0018230.mRNA.1.CDS.1 [Saccharomyces cerevisiae]CAI6900727.1 ANM_HP_G0161700.mRNA.1.CDS.1 [Saccharomyces cerevisiae]CAI7011802.1 ANM_HP_G0260060.mRNA.1.CDS.1 [Saccharomyces cerevisiae]